MESSPGIPLNAGAGFQESSTLCSLASVQTVIMVAVDQMSIGIDREKLTSVLIVCRTNSLLVKRWTCHTIWIRTTYVQKLLLEVRPCPLGEAEEEQVLFAFFHNGTQTVGEEMSRYLRILGVRNATLTGALLNIGEPRLDVFFLGASLEGEGKVPGNRCFENYAGGFVWHIVSRRFQQLGKSIAYGVSLSLRRVRFSVLPQCAKRQARAHHRTI